MGLRESELDFNYFFQGDATLASGAEFVYLIRNRTSDKCYFTLLQTRLCFTSGASTTSDAPQQISGNYQQTQQPAAAAVENCTSPVRTKGSLELKALLPFLCLIAYSLIRPRQRTLIQLQLFCCSGTTR